MTTNKEKTAIVLFGSAIFLWFFFLKEKIKPKELKLTSTVSMDGNSKDELPEIDVNRIPIKSPTINPKELEKSQKVSDAYNALAAYIAAYNAGEKQSDLDTMVRDMRSQMGMNVYKRRDGRMAVSDTSGKDIIVNNL